MKYDKDLGGLFGDKEVWFMVICTAVFISGLVVAGYLLYDLIV